MSISKISKPDSRIVLVGGSGRSGTNITKQLIGRHSQVFSLPFETRFTVDPDGLVDFYSSFQASWSPYTADIRLKRLKLLLETLGSESFFDRFLGEILDRIDPRGRVFSPRRYHGWQLKKIFHSYEEHVENLLEALISFTYKASWVGTKSYQFQPSMAYGSPKKKEELASVIGGFINGLVSECLMRQEREVFVDDNTWNLPYAKQLLDFTPQAKLIHVYRDPRDVVSSLLGQRWAPGKVEHAAIWYRDIMERWLTTRESLPKDSLLEISLEGLVADPEKVVREICDFIGLRMEPEMLLIDLSESNTGRWNRDLTQGQKTKVRTILGNMLNELGYE